VNNYTLYGSELSYYTGKVRAYLDWKGLNYTEQSGSLDVFKKIILPNVGRGIIPVLKTPDDQYIQDSTEIINTLEQRHPEPPMGASGPLQTFVSLLIDLFADEWLIIPALHYRWNYNEEWTYKSFGETSLPDASDDEQYNFGKSRGQFFRNWMPEVGISDATIPGIEQSYQTFLTHFSNHLEHHPFTFGGRPSRADFALYGPLYAHLYRDPESGEMMKRLAPGVTDWVERCRDISQAPAQGELLSNDEVPATLYPLLELQMREQLPVLLASDSMLAEYAKTAAPESDLPRGFKTTACTIGGHTGECLGRSFPLWRLQAAMDHYHHLQSADRTNADQLLDASNGSALKNFQLSKRLARRGAQIVIES